jgi:hypothetical protein
MVLTISNPNHVHIIVSLKFIEMQLNKYREIFKKRNIYVLT